MGLVVWLPLTKDLRNQGLSNVIVTNNGVTYSSTGGKLGGTYSATASGQTITINFANLSTMLANGKTYTLTCWVKPTGTPSSGWVIKLGDNSCGLWWAKSEARWVWNENDNGKRCANPTISADYTNWHHLAIVVDKTVSGKITTQQYVDGVLAAGYPGSTWDCSSHSQPAGTVITISPYVSQLNDIRLYNHCLSSMEVKELAKGLVLHYPLNRQGWGQENLVRGTYDWQRWTFSNRAVKNQDEATLNGSTADWGASIHSAHLAKSLLDGTTIYTWSFEYKSTVAWSCHPVIGGTATDIDATSNSRTKYTYWQSATTLPTTGGAWKRYILTSRTIIESQMTSGSGDVNNWFLQIYNRTDNSAVEIRRIKLEKGSTATPWCPNSTDTLYSTLGLNGTTEYDCSGFCNNGTWHGTYTNTSNTPKYAVSTTATGSGTTYLEGPVLPAEAKTVALWIKNTSKSSNGAIFNDKTSGLQIGLLNSLLYMNSAASTAGFTTTHWVNGEWNHVVAINNNGTRSLYVNGQAETQSGASNYYIHNADNCWLWNRSYNNSYPFTGSLCDLRVYTTALSADDVKSLYQNCATIDPDGTIRGQIRS